MDKKVNKEASEAFISYDRIGHTYAHATFSLEILQQLGRIFYWRNRSMTMGLQQSSHLEKAGIKLRRGFLRSQRCKINTCIELSLGRFYARLLRQRTKRRLELSLLLCQHQARPLFGIWKRREKRAPFWPSRVPLPATWSIYDPYTTKLLLSSLAILCVCEGALFPFFFINQTSYFG